MTRHVIIGNGIAGINAAETIRRIEPEADIYIIAGETFPPYSRPMISLVLEGRLDHDRLAIRGPDFYKKNRINVSLGEKVESIDLEGRKVFTDLGQAVDFDRLLIASGADPRRIKVPGEDLENVSFFRTQDHAQKVLKSLPDVKRALVLGGGLVAFKSAYGLMKRGIKVTMLISSGYPLSMQVDGMAGKLILDELTTNGLEIRTGAEVTAFEGIGTVSRAHLSDGTSMNCDLVMIGKGVKPSVGPVPKDRIRVDLGILVDHHLETTSPGIFAAGDVAQAMDVVRNETWVNAIWPVAAEQGIIAGNNMAGRPVVYRGSFGRNVMRVHSLDVMSGGITNPKQSENYRIFTSTDNRNRLYRKLVLRDDKLVGMTMIGNIEQGGVILSLIQRQLPLTQDPEQMLEPSFNFSSVFTETFRRRRNIE